MTTQKNTEQHDHDYVWALLPWYVNDGLSRQEINEVQTHLQGCSDCQKEVARCREVSATVKTNRPDEWTPSAPHFSKILANVDAFERRQAKPQRSSNWIVKWLPWFDVTPRPARFALALQGALVIALATTLLVRGLFPAQPFTTLSNPAAPAVGAGQQVRLVFSEDITEKELRALVLGVDGRFVTGPSAQGVYTIALLSSNSNAQTITQVLTQLRIHPKVRLAEAVNVTVE
jgi:Putative zinc-finger